MLGIGNTIYANLDSGTAQTLATSTDGGSTFALFSWNFPKTAAGSFVPETFVQYGAGYAGAQDIVPGTNSPYVYAYGGKVGDPTKIFLSRVPASQIATQAAWQWFTGTNQSPTWGTWGNAQPVLIDTTMNDPLAGANAISSSYSAVWFPQLGRYVVTARKVLISELRVYDSPKPWGPWTTAYSSDNWGNFPNITSQQETVSLNIHPSLLSADNKTFWLTYSSIGSQVPGDNYNLVKGTISP